MDPASLELRARFFHLDDDELGLQAVEYGSNFLVTRTLDIAPGSREAAFLEVAMFLVSVDASNLGNHLVSTRRPALVAARDLLVEMGFTEEAACATAALAFYEGDHVPPDFDYDAASTLDEGVVRDRHRRAPRVGAWLRAHGQDFGFAWLTMKPSHLPDPTKPRLPRDHFGLRVTDPGVGPRHLVRYGSARERRVFRLRVVETTITDGNDDETYLAKTVAALLGGDGPTESRIALRPRPPAPSTREHLVSVEAGEEPGSLVVRTWFPQQDAQRSRAWVFPWSDCGPARPVLENGDPVRFAAQGAHTLLAVLLAPLPPDPVGTGARWTAAYRTDKGTEVQLVGEAIAVSEGGATVLLEVATRYARGDAISTFVRNNRTTATLSFSSRAPLPTMGGADVLDVENGYASARRTTTMTGAFSFEPR